MELLALRWHDVDLEAGHLRVRHQLTRAKRDEPAKLVPLMTDSGRRDVVLMSELASLLRAYKLASPNDSYLLCKQVLGCALFALTALRSGRAAPVAALQSGKVNSNRSPWSTFT